MTVLSDRAILDRYTAGDTLVWPCPDRAKQPASIDVRLGSDLLVYRDPPPYGFIIDPEQSDDHMVGVSIGGHFDLSPMRFALGSTYEKVAIPPDCVGILVGVSTLARRGLQIEAAGLLDPDWQGHPTLELMNLAPYPFRLRPGMRIGQVYFLQMDQESGRLYGHPDLGSRYQGHRLPMPGAPEGGRV